MEPFEIKLLEDHFTIEPLENGLYRIMDGENKLGVIYAEAEGDQVVWATQDELDKDLYSRSVNSLRNTICKQLW